MTSGNPFFVTEVLAAGDGDRVPSTVVDAVLARVRRLDAASQDALDQLATVPSRGGAGDGRHQHQAGWPRWRPGHGLLTVSPASVAFRHSSPAGR